MGNSTGDDYNGKELTESVQRRREERPISVPQRKELRDSASKIGRERKGRSLRGKVMKKGVKKSMCTRLPKRRGGKKMGKGGKTEPGQTQGTGTNQLKGKCVQASEHDEQIV